MYPAGSFKHSELAAFEGFTTTELDQANFPEIDLFVPPPGFSESDLYPKRAVLSISPAIAYSFIL